MRVQTHEDASKHRTREGNVAAPADRVGGLSPLVLRLVWGVFFFCIRITNVSSLIFPSSLTPFKPPFLLSINKNSTYLWSGHTHMPLCQTVDHSPRFFPLLLHTVASPPTSHKSFLSAHRCYQAGAPSASWSTDNKALQQSIHVNNSFA